MGNERPGKEISSQQQAPMLKPWKAPDVTISQVRNTRTGMIHNGVEPSSPPQVPS